MFFIELKRGFSKKSFKVAVGIGIIFSILSISKSFTYNKDILNEYINGYINNSFSNFIIFNLNPISNLFIIIIPILSSLGYADSYIEDVQYGLIKNIYTKKSKLAYVISKYWANFIIGGITLSVPLLLNYLILILLYPSIPSDPILGKLTILEGGLFYRLFYSNGNLYIIMWIIIYFLYAGSFASIALCFSKVIKNKFIVIFIPFILYFLIEIFAEVINKLEYSPQYFLYLGTDQNFHIVLGEFLLSFIITFILFCFGGLNNDTY